MKRAFLFFSLFFSVLVAAAQTTPLQVQLDNQGKPYLVHSIGPKENFYSIGRIYNISPRVFAPYNGLELTSALSIGQQIRIPLNEVNFWQTGTRKENETVVPVYHTAKAGETVAKLGQLFGTDNASIKSWNNIESVSAGNKVIVGFLKVDKTLSPLAAKGMNVRSEPNVVKQQPKPEEPKKQDVVVKKEEPKQEVVVKKEEPKPEVKKEEPKMEVSPASYGGNGFFKDEFNRQSNNGRRTDRNNGPGSVFKSTSGWSDGKYYVLMDNVEKGTIIMVRNPANGKAVYAKVLGSVEETSPGSGLLFRLSNSAAAQLGISTEKFNAELVWGK
ncbi:LysM peptidoglycan-binding domain-containing protein [Lacibacter sediminis]|uniref:LysM peptidoglycan-binding domain-containing protein n=1 Tax=Lacibacter sediminis TaxID=2760713 RepID=A0A7G5XKL5_9BACT|nr:LysM peptidoglycan-binding domain-containing protein [Lacibacter sediminis]QNA46018.1 LysM peptidoglycan-binding domain-containing protein [Lacibacter sediminis]